MAESKSLRKRYMEKRCHMIASNHYISYLGKGAGGGLYTFAQAVPHPPAWLASLAVSPYHVAQKLKHFLSKIKMVSIFLR